MVDLIYLIDSLLPTNACGTSYLPTYIKPEEDGDDSKLKCRKEFKETAFRDATLIVYAEDGDDDADIGRCWCGTDHHHRVPAW